MRVGKILLAVAITFGTVAGSPISYLGGTYTQDFNSLTGTNNTTAAWVNDGTIAGWSLFIQPAPGTAPSTYTIRDGVGSTQTFYSFGTSGAADRALGAIPGGGANWGNPATGAVAGWVAVALTNNTGGGINSVTLTFNGEQWRDDNVAANTISLEYGFGATFGAVAGWTSAGALFDFTSPVHTNSNAVDGNAAGRVNGIGGLLNLGSTWANGSTLWFRWVYNNNTAGNEHGMAIDDLSFQGGAVAGVPEPATWQLLGGALLLGGLLRARRRR